MVAPAGVVAATIYANPGDSLTGKINGMSPGDTLVLNPGSYYTTVRINNKNGDAGHWFTMRGSGVGTARIAATGYANIFELRNSSYWRFENFAIDGNNYHLQ